MPSRSKKLPGRRTPRFERPAGETCAYGGTIRIRHGVPDREHNDTASCLARMWTLFGRPDDHGGYVIRDRKTDCDFRVTFGPSGVTYDGEADDKIIDAFEKTLYQVPLADCRYRVGFEEEYGGGSVWLGAKDGVSFRRSAAMTSKQHTEKLRKARRALSSKSTNVIFWYGELESVRTMLAQKLPSAVRPQARTVARLLWKQLFGTLEQWIAASGQPGPEVDLVVPELRELADTLEIDFARFKDRYDRIEEAAKHLRF